jgi:hypothetical protein
VDLGKAETEDAGQATVDCSVANDPHRATRRHTNSAVAMCDSDPGPEIHYRFLLGSITDLSFVIKRKLRQSLTTFYRDESNNECYG